ncbi:hypothetical protein HDU96_000146 [Phlyctochytrium bullatum]|nr:hypothetical protein HDU96_000146 [Phlyctochytrium bullatum]
MPAPSGDLFDVAKKGDNVSARLILAAEKNPSTLLKQQRDVSEVGADSGGTAMSLCVESSFKWIDGDKSADVESRNQQKNTPLHIAAGKGHLPVAQLLIESGADIEARGFEERTPLHAVAVEGQLEVAKFLIDKGADIKSSDKHKDSPLILAALKGHLPVAKLLIERGVNIETNGFVGRTALHAATVHGHLEVVRFLLENGAYGAYIECGDDDEYKSTPLIIAAAKGHFPVVRCLVENGADVGAKDCYDDTARDRARYYGHAAIVEFLSARMR